LLPVPSGLTVNIQQPGPDVPPKAAAFIGKWGGVVPGGQLPINLIVESVLPTGEVHGIYVWGSSEIWRIQSGATRFVGKIDDVLLHWKNANLLFQFTMRQDGNLDFERYNGSNRDAKGVVSRIQ
jgi:hypothetical protein